MLKRIIAIVALAMFAASSPAMAGMAIGFSDDQLDANPGFRITNGVLEFGSNLPNNGDNIDFLRIQTVNFNAPAAIQNFIITLPDFALVPVQALPGEDCTGIIKQQRYGLVPIGAPLFKIYFAADTNLLDPLVTGIVNPGGALMVGAGGQVYFDVNYTDVVNLLQTSVNTILYPELNAFIQQANPGADLSGSLSSAGGDLCVDINANRPINGSSNGDIIVPEPGTIMLLVAGGISMIRSRRRAA